MVALLKNGSFEFHPYFSDDGWVRDSGLIRLFSVVCLGVGDFSLTILGTGLTALLKVNL